MTALVDAFLVELELDPSKFSRGSKDAVNQILNLKQRAKQTAGEYETAYRNIAQDFETIARKIVGVAAGVLGGISLTRFVQNVVEANRQLGIMSDLTGNDIEDLSKLKGAFDRMGASGANVLNVLGQWSRELQGMEANSLDPASSKLVGLADTMRSYGANVSLYENGKPKKSMQLLLEITDAMEKLKIPEVRKTAILRDAGFDDETIYGILKGGESLRKFLADQGDFLSISEDQRRTTDKLRRERTELVQSVEKLGQSIIEHIAGPLERVLTATTKLVQFFDKTLRDPNSILYIRPEDWAGTGSLFGGGKGSGSDASGGTAGKADADKGTRLSPSTSGPAGLGKEPPQAVLDKAKQVALEGGPVAVSQFMREQGYPKQGNWCGEFAAAVIKSVGGTPPKNPAIASNWRNWGKSTDTPQPGDIAVRKGAPTGATGSHVTIVENYDPNSGRFSGIGGNQGSARSNFPINRYEFRHSDPKAQSLTTVPAILFPPGMLGMPTGPVVNKKENKSEIGNVTVNSQASDPAGIAADIKRAIENSAQTP